MTRWVMLGQQARGQGGAGIQPERLGGVLQGVDVGQARAWARWRVVGGRAGGDDGRACGVSGGRAEGEQRAGEWAGGLAAVAGRRVGASGGRAEVEQERRAGGGRADGQAGGESRAAFGVLMFGIARQ